jgi:hypothetical protein
MTVTSIGVYTCLFYLEIRMCVISSLFVYSLFYLISSEPFTGERNLVSDTSVLHLFLFSRFRFLNHTTNPETKLPTIVFFGVLGGAFEKIAKSDY